MEENISGDNLGEDLRKFGNQLLKGMELQRDFVKNEMKRIQNELELIPKKETRKRYEYLIEERRNNRKEKAEFEFNKKLENDSNWYLFPRASRDIDSRISELIKIYEEYMRLDVESPSERKTIRPITQLSNFFESQQLYTTFMKLLVKKGLCQAETFIWKDDKKGNKGHLAAIIKFLHPQGYYKENSKPTNEEIMLIAKSTFGWEMSIDTIKKATPADFDLKFILPASPLK